MSTLTVDKFPDWLRRNRLDSSYSQAALASLLHVSQVTISLWERDKTRPDEVQLLALENIFGGRAEATDPELEGSAEPASSGWGGQYPLDAVFVRVEPRSVIDIVRRIRDKRYDLSPDFQRAFVWNIEKQSRLVESCLMRIPLPVLYVAEAPDGRIIVVDGLQRLTTFRRFLDNDFKLSFPSTEEENKHPLEGKAFRDLDIKLQERIEDTTLTLYILDSKAPERAKLDIFDRVNSGVPLSRQQMRNSLHNGPATLWLREAAESALFKKVTGESLNTITMRDREAINRFCAFSLLGWQNYKSGDMDGLLADALQSMNRKSADELLELRKAFDHALQLNFDLFGEHAFRKSLAGPGNGNRSILNIAFFDVCTVWLSKLTAFDIILNFSAITNKFKELLNNPRFVTAITYSTNSRKQVQDRFEMMRESLQEFLP